MQALEVVHSGLLYYFLVLGDFVHWFGVAIDLEEVVTCIFSLSLS